MQGLRRTLSISALVLLTALTGCGTSTAMAGHHDTTTTTTQTDAQTPVCAEVSACHVVATIDVDGDHRPDQVGWHQVSQDVVQIRVRTASGRLLLHRVDVHLWWGGGAWAGATRVDGSPGAELLVGSMQGAHTPMYTMLTYRAGALRVENSPSPLSSRWQVDAAWGDDMGWQHHLINGRPAMTQRIVVRTEGGQTFTGHSVTYLWMVNHWARSSSTAISYPNPRAAAAIAGFHVPGLAAFPGLR